MFPWSPILKLSEFLFIKGSRMSLQEWVKGLQSSGQRLLETIVPYPFTKDWGNTNCLCQQLWGRGPWKIKETLAIVTVTAYYKYSGWVYWNYLIDRMVCLDLNHFLTLIFWDFIPACMFPSLLWSFALCFERFWRKRAGIDINQKRPYKEMWNSKLVSKKLRS